MVREDDLRDVFGALHAGNDPDLGFGAADVVRAGERVRRRRRTVAAVGSGLATVAAVVVAIVLLPGGQAPAPEEPAGPVTSLTTTSTRPVPPSTPTSVPNPPIETSPGSPPAGSGDEDGQDREGPPLSITGAPTSPGA